MTTQSAYSSTHPDVLAAMDALDAAQAEWRASVDALRDELNVEGEVLYSDSWGTRSFRGFVSPPDVDGVQWRRVQNGYWPKQTTKAGKALHARLSGIKYKLRNLPGMPESVMHGFTSYSHGMARWDGVVWVTWGCSHDIVEGIKEGGRVDFTIWQQRRLSEFYAAREAHEEPAPDA